MDKFWHWTREIIQVVVVLVALLEFPFAVARVVRWWPTAQNWWSLRSRRRAELRLAKLETDLKKLDDPLPMEQRQAEFYNCVFFIMYALGAGLFLATVYFAHVHVFSFSDENILTLSGGFLLIAVAVAGWGMFRFAPLLPSQREQRRRQIEQGIKKLRDKLQK